MASWLQDEIPPYGCVPSWNGPLSCSEFPDRLTQRSPSMIGSQSNIAKRPIKCSQKSTASISGSFFTFYFSYKAKAIVRHCLHAWRKTQFSGPPILLWIGTLLLLPVSAFCSRGPKPVPDGLRVDQLGESLKVFRSVHPKAHCDRVHGEWAEENPRKTWLLWVHCSLDTGVTFGGYELLSESNPRYPFGAYATFYRKRLIEITYTLSNASIAPLVSLIAQECGQPLDLTKDDYGALTGAFWVTKRFSVVVRSIPIQALASDDGILIVTNDVFLFATSVTITAKDEPRD